MSTLSYSGGTFGPQLLVKLALVDTDGATRVRAATVEVILTSGSSC